MFTLCALGATRIYHLQQVNMIWETTHQDAHPLSLHTQCIHRTVIGQRLLQMADIWVYGKGVMSGNPAWVRGNGPRSRLGSTMLVRW